MAHVHLKVMLCARTAIKKRSIDCLICLPSLWLTGGVETNDSPCTIRTSGIRKDGSAYQRIIRVIARLRYKYNGLGPTGIAFQVP